MANVEFPEYVIVFCSNWAGCRHVWLWVTGHVPLKLCVVGVACYGTPGFERLGINQVAVMITKDQQVFVPSFGCDRESAS